MAKVNGPYMHGRKWRIMWKDGATPRFADYQTREEACREKERMEGEKSNGSSQPSITCLIKDYLGHIEKCGFSRKTIRPREYRLSQWLAGGISLEDFTDHVLRETYKDRQQKIAIATCHQELAIIKSFFGWCVENGYSKSNPAKGLRKEGRAHRGKPKLRGHEAARLIDWCVEHGDDYVPTLICLMLGLRVGEVLALKARDIDSCAGMVDLWVDKGKTENAERRIRVSYPLSEILPRLASGVKPEDRLFTVDETTIRKRTRKACLGAMVPYSCPHGLRATFLTLSREAGTATDALVKIAGHGGSKVLLAHYVSPGSHRSAQVDQVATTLGFGNGNTHSQNHYQSITGAPNQVNEVENGVLPV